MGFSLDAAGQKLKRKTSHILVDKWGASNDAKNLTWHYMVGMWEQIIAVIPISLLQVGPM